MRRIRQAVTRGEQLGAVGIRPPGVVVGLITSAPQSAGRTRNPVHGQLRTGGYHADYPGRTWLERCCVRGKQQLGVVDPQATGMTPSPREDKGRGTVVASAQRIEPSE